MKLTCHLASIQIQFALTERGAADSVSMKYTALSQQCCVISSSGKTNFTPTALLSYKKKNKKGTLLFFICKKIKKKGRNK